MASRESRRAEAAYVAVLNQKAPGEVTEPEAKYKRFAKRFPALVLQAGLMQALAFAQSKAPQGFLDGLAKVVEDPAALDGVTLADEARTAETVRYQWLTRESLAAASWLKRYAEALLRDSKSEKEVFDDASLS